MAAAAAQGVPSELDLVDAEDQISHELSLDDELVAETGLDVFKVDPEVCARGPAVDSAKKRSGAAV